MFFILFISMKDEILKLRNEGKTYNQIKAILNCSKSTISYHLGEGQKEKTDLRHKKRRENIIIRKVEGFRNRKIKNNRERVRKFAKRDNNSKGLVNKNAEQKFDWEDVVNKFGEDTVCYLSGVAINLYDDNYNFDHIIPVTKGGENNFDNLGITHEVVNRMKNDLKCDELFMWCKRILEYNGYEVKKLK